MRFRRVLTPRQFANAFSFKNLTQMKNRSILVAENRGQPWYITPLKKGGYLAWDTLCLSIDRTQKFDELITALHFVLVCAAYKEASVYWECIEQVDELDALKAMDSYFFVRDYLIDSSKRTRMFWRYVNDEMDLTIASVEAQWWDDAYDSYQMLIEEAISYDPQDFIAYEEKFFQEIDDGNSCPNVLHELELERGLKNGDRTEVSIYNVTGCLRGNQKVRHPSGVSGS